jgi:hypothetical protein
VAPAADLGVRLLHIESFSRLDVVVLTTAVRDEVSCGGVLSFSLLFKVRLEVDEREEDEVAVVVDSSMGEDEDCWFNDEDALDDMEEEEFNEAEFIMSTLRPPPPPFTPLWWPVS